MTGRERKYLRHDRDRLQAARKRKGRATIRKLAFESLEIRRVLAADFLQLTFANDNVVENSGEGGVEATLTRTHEFGDYSAPLEVNLTYSDVSELNGAASVTIPSGQQSVTVEMNVVDDTLLDGDQSVNVTVSSDGYLGSTVELTVQDHETLTFHVASGVREDGQSLAVEIERSDTSDLLAQSLTITSDNAALSGSSLVLPAGVARASFALDVNDDNLLTGDRLVSLVANSTGFVSGSAQVTVTDHETLTLSTNGSSMSESGGRLVGSVLRSVGPVDVDLEVALSLNDTSEASVPSTVTIPAGANQVAFTIEAVDDSLLDGDQSVQLTATATGFFSDDAGFEVLDSEALTLELSASSVSENANGSSLLATVTRPAGQDQQTLLITVRSSDTSRIQVPNTVTIPAGLDTVLFFVEPQDDQLLTGPIDVQISAVALHYVSAEANLTVEDYESLSLTLDSEHLRESDDGLLTVSRSNQNNALPLTVFLSASPSAELLLPAEVTIPAGSSSVDVALSPVDDNVIEDPITVNLQATASGYIPAAASIDVVDVEKLSLSPSTNLVAENAGPGAIELTIIRFNEDVTGELTVQLQSTDTSEIQTPSQVTIPAGQRSIVATLDVIDDSVLDGEQPVDIIASAVGYEDTTYTIIVSDAEALTLEIRDASITESDGDGATTATVRRSNSDTSAPLRVAILNSDASEAKAPSVVEIPAGSQSVTFSIDAVDDLVVDGDQIVTLTAVATGYQESEDQLKVVDFSGFASWTNPDEPMDVDDNSSVNVRDALLLVYELRTRGPQVLPRPTPGFRPPPWLDTNADGNFNTLDVFLVIEYINNHRSSTRNAAEGEGQRQAQQGSAQQDTTLGDQGRSAVLVASDAPANATFSSVADASTSTRSNVVTSTGTNDIDNLDRPLHGAEQRYHDLAIAETIEGDEPLADVIDEIAGDVDDVFGAL